MPAHSFFTRLQVHSDEELEERLGVTIVERTTVHEWPLSWVQRLRLADGRQMIYKSQLPPTVEPEFYARATSPLLPGHRRLEDLGECSTLLFDWIEAPLLRDAAGSEAALIDHGRQVVARIGEIRGDLPVYLDIGSAGAWSSVATVTLEKLRQLVLDGRFGSTGMEAVERARRWAASPQVIETIIHTPRVIHGDLTAAQVFVTEDGYRVIDWQRPVLGPPEVDLVALLVGEVGPAGARADPRAYLDAAVVGIFWFLRLYWAVEAQFDLFPDFRGALFDHWAAEAIGELHE